MIEITIHRGGLVTKAPVVTPSAQYDEVLRAFLDAAERAKWPREARVRVRALRRQLPDYWLGVYDITDPTLEVNAIVEKLTAWRALG